jgi:short-subunit dehydrogenase
MLVNNAGFGFAAAFHQQPLDKVAAMVDLNCRVPAVLSRAFVEPMIARRRGAIITLSSVAGFESIPYFSLYSATKAFDLLLGEGLSVELKPFGIDSLVIAPGVTMTEFAEVAGTRHYGGNIATPEAVVEGGLRVLGRRHTYIHGARNRMIVFMLRRLLPRRFTPDIVGRAMRKSMREEALRDLQEAERGA